jgi:hypothetical protein
VSDPTRVSALQELHSALRAVGVESVLVAAPVRDKKSSRCSLYLLHWQKIKVRILMQSEEEQQQAEERENRRGVGGIHQICEHKCYIHAG